MNHSFRSFDLPYLYEDLSKSNVYPYPKNLLKYVKSELNIAFQTNISIGNNLEGLNHFSELYTWAHFNKHLTLGAITALTNKNDGEKLLGTNTSRGKHTGSVNYAYLNSVWKSFQIFLGKSNIQWGPGRWGQLGLAGNIPTMDMIKFTFKRNDLFRLTSFVSQLDKKKFLQDSLQTKFINRWLAGHRLEIYLFEKKIILGLGDYILYTGINRGLELYYLNPLNPFHSQTFEGKGIDERTQEEKSDLPSGDNQNEAIFFDASYWIIPNLNIYSELFIDDLQVDIEDRRNIDDMLGFTLGVAGANQFDSGIWHYNLEASTINTWVYNHLGMATNWTYKNQFLGFSEGSDLWKLTVRNEWWFNLKTMAALQFSTLHQGEISVKDKWNPYETKDSKFPFGTVENTTILQSEFFWHPKKWIILKALFTYKNIDNYLHIQDHSREDTELILNLQFVL